MVEQQTEVATPDGGGRLSVVVEALFARTASDPRWLRPDAPRSR